MSIFRPLLFSLLMALLVTGAGCGYHFQGTENPLAKIGIRKIYVTNFKNNTIRPGLEHAFTSAMVREIRKGRVFELVTNREEADAILTGVVAVVDDAPTNTSADIDSTPINIAASFNARVTCSVALLDQSKRVIFADTFGGNKVHPASIVFDGTNRIKQGANATAPLINESEQRLAIKYLSEQMMLDAYQKMIDIF